MKCVFRSKSVNDKSFKVMFDPHHYEYTVKFYTNEAHQVEADYFTSSKDDAINTGVVWQMSKAKENVK